MHNDSDQNGDSRTDYGSIHLVQEPQNMNIKRNLLVDIFAIAFGIGAWISINGIWVELPLLVQELPEKWALPSYLSVIIQIANLGPISYGIARHLKPNMKSVSVISFILFIGGLASLLLVFLWDKTSIVGTTERSTSLLSLVFFMALVDCTSSVLYIPYMAVWKEMYFTSYLIGEGLSGLLPGFVSLIQGVGGEPKCVNMTNNFTGGFTMQPAPLEPNFSVTGFFGFILAMSLVSALAFIGLEMLPSLNTEREPNHSGKVSTGSGNPVNALVTNGNALTRIKKPTYFGLLAMQSWACFLANGFMVSFQSYSCGPYGNVPYHLAVTLSALANPIVATITMFLHRANAKLIAGISMISSAIAIVLLYTAVLSPTPPFVGTTLGSTLIVLAWVLWGSATSYVRIEINNVLREEGPTPLFWSGVTTQAGSAVGAIIAFGLVNWTAIFRAYDPCSGL